MEDPAPDGGDGVEDGISIRVVADGLAAYCVLLVSVRERYIERSAHVIQRARGGGDITGFVRGEVDVGQAEGAASALIRLR